MRSPFYGYTDLFFDFFFKCYQESIDYPTIHGDICYGIGVVNSVRKKMVCQELESSSAKSSQLSDWDPAGVDVSRRGTGQGRGGWEWSTYSFLGQEEEGTVAQDT